MRGIFFVLLAINIVYGLHTWFLSGEIQYDKEYETKRHLSAHPGADRLQLLVEPEPIGTPELNKETGSKLKSQVNNRKNDYCAVIGPFGAMNTLRAFKSKWLKTLSTLINVTEKEGAGVEIFLVKVDLKNQPSDALYVIQKLQTFGLDGYLVMDTSGSAVVVGQYHAVSAARRAEQKAKQAGLTILTEKKKQKKHLYWIKIVDDVSKTELRRALADYLRKNDDIILSQSLCQ